MSSRARPSGVGLELGFQPLCVLALVSVELSPVVFGRVLKRTNERDFFFWFRVVDSDRAASNVPTDF